jgi:apolipoprotein N-acyltransferase
VTSAEATGAVVYPPDVARGVPVLPGGRGYRRLIAVAGGGLLALAFPWPDCGPLAWIALVPLLWVGLGHGPGVAFRTGWLFGVAFFLGTLYWIVFTISHYTALSPLIAVGPLLLLCGFLGLFPATFALGGERARQRGVPLALAAPPLWVTLEWVRGWILGGFPWVGLGYSQWRATYLIQFVELTGVHGMSALLVLVNVVVYAAFRRWRDGRAPSLWSLWATAALLVTLMAGGYVRVHALAALPPAGETRIGVIQGNIPQDVKWDPAYQWSTIEHYEALTEKAAAAGATLIVWPEAAAPIFFQNEDELRERIRALARRLDVWLIFGSAAYSRTVGDEFVLHNRAYVLAPAGDEQFYDKMKLVPFGEYVPLADLFFFVHKIVEGVGDFRPGTAAVVADTPYGRFGILICYEGIFPSLTRRFVAGGADFLVNITNDAWFGRTSAPSQHLAMGTLRAIENRVPVVRVANTGFSAMVDVDGTIRWQTGLFETAWRVDTVRWVGQPTVYTRVGDVFVAACVLITVGFALVAILTWRHRT